MNAYAIPGLRNYAYPIVGDQMVKIIKDKAVLAEENNENDPVVSPADIVALVCERFAISVEEIKSKTNKHAIAKPRHIAMFLIYFATKLGLADIGALFGGKDHATVSHAKKTVMGLIDIQDQYGLIAQEMLSKYKLVKNYE